MFYVDTLEHLRRGGRIGRPSALLGSALAIKPILGLKDGSIVPLERVRTSSRAIARLEDIAAEAADTAGSGSNRRPPPRLRGPGREARRTLARRRARARRPLLVELGAVVGAHVGPGTLAIAVSPRV